MMIIRFIGGTELIVTGSDEIEDITEAIEKKDKWVELFYSGRYINLDTVTYVEVDNETDN